MRPLGLSQNALARGIGVSPRRVNEIVLGKRRVTAETALRLARYFDTTPQFWLGLQADYDLDVAIDELGDRLDREVHRPSAAV
jgi:addiction module HigA family antidote